MVYTVAKLANISGVSVRTLHWYDKMGLLKPSYYGSNGYRYYEDEQLLTLQQILFFRELGFELKQIQKTLERSDFDKVVALKSHRKILKKNLERTNQLIKTLDKTIEHLKGSKKMIDHEIYLGFSKEKQVEYDKYLINRWGTQAKELIAEMKINTKTWKKEDYEKIKHDGKELYKQLTIKINENEKFNSKTVQGLIKKHYQIIKKVYNPSKEGYIHIAQLYIDHVDFRVILANYHPELPEFLGKAMKLYAKNELSD